MDSTSQGIESEKFETDTFLVDLAFYRCIFLGLAN